MELVMIGEAGEGGFSFFGDQTERSNPPLSSETLRNIYRYAVPVPIYVNRRNWCATMVCKKLTTRVPVRYSDSLRPIFLEPML